MIPGIQHLCNELGNGAFLLLFENVQGKGDLVHFDLIQFLNGGGGEEISIEPFERGVPEVDFASVMGRLNKQCREVTESAGHRFFRLCLALEGEQEGDATFDREKLRRRLIPLRNDLSSEYDMVLFLIEQNTLVLYEVVEPF